VTGCLGSARGDGDGTVYEIVVRCRLIFKLTDFGATREMSANAGIQTLYGTEEYLVC